MTEKEWIKSFADEWNEIFKGYAGTGGVTVGLPVGIVALNNFKNTTANDTDLGYNFGVALETAGDTEFFILELGKC